MIVDTMERLALYEGILPKAKEVAALWSAGSLDSTDAVDARWNSYDSRPDEVRRFEVHHHTIDLMIGRTGIEVIHVCPVSDLEEGEPLPDGADGRFLIGGPRGCAVMLRPGFFVALFPGEAHMCAGQRVPGEVTTLEKWVVKLPG